jgi:hypothetical protein
MLSGLGIVLLIIFSLKPKPTGTFKAPFIDIHAKVTGFLIHPIVFVDI